MANWEPMRQRLEAAAAQASREKECAVRVPCADLVSLVTFVAALRKPPGLEHTVKPDGAGHALVVFGGQRTPTVFD